MLPIRQQLSNVFLMKRRKCEDSRKSGKAVGLWVSTEISDFNNRNVHFLNYANVLQRYNFRPTGIYIIDETNVATLLKPAKIVAVKGKKQIKLTAWAERGEPPFLV